MTDYGLNVSQASKKATFPVLFNHPRKGSFPGQKHEHASTSIHLGATGLSASFHISTANVFTSDIPNLNVGEENEKLLDPQQCQSTQLIEHLFKLVTPINPSKLDQLLQNHPNRKLVQEVVTGFQKGFSLKYNGPRENCQPHNLPTAYSYPEKLWDSLMKEVK